MDIRWSEYIKAASVVAICALVGWGAHWEGLTEANIAGSCPVVLGTPNTLDSIDLKVLHTPPDELWTNVIAPDSRQTARQLTVDSIA